MRPTEALWGLPEQIAAASYDALRVLIWQKSGGNASNYPEPTVRPGVEPAKKVRGNDPLPLDEMREWLGWDEATTKAK